MSTEEVDSHDALHRRKMRRVEEPVEKKGDSPSSSSSDAHNEPHDDTGDHDDHTKKHDAQSDCDDQSEGTMLKRHQLTDNVSVDSTPVAGTPESRKADPIPASVEETTEAFSPAPIEASTISGGSQTFHIDQDTHLNQEDQLQVPVQGNLSPEQSILPPARGMQSQLPPSNLPVDQPVRSVFGIQATGFSAHNVNNYINLPTPNLPPELPLPSAVRFPGSQLNPSHSQVLSQVGNGIAIRTQWANSHPQQQINMFEPSITSRQQEIQFQRLLPHVSLPPNNSIYQSGGSPYLQLPSNPIQPGMGAYNMGPFVPLHMEELPAIGDFNHGLGLGVQGPFLSGSHIGLGESSPRQPSRPPLVNMTWSDIVHPTRAPELTNRFPQVQGAQGQAPNNRPMFNSVYDPMYEAMGLPIDPHLRMFLASKRDRDSGK